MQNKSITPNKLRSCLKTTSNLKSRRYYRNTTSQKHVIINDSPIRFKFNDDVVEQETKKTDIVLKVLNIQNRCNEEINIINKLQQNMSISNADISNENLILDDCVADQQKETGIFRSCLIVENQNNQKYNEIRIEDDQKEDDNSNKCMLNVSESLEVSSAIRDNEQRKRFDIFREDKIISSNYINEDNYNQESELFSEGKIISSFVYDINDNKADFMIEKAKEDVDLEFAEKNSNLDIELESSEELEKLPTLVELYHKISDEIIIPKQQALLQPKKGIKVDSLHSLMKNKSITFSSAKIIENFSKETKSMYLNSLENCTRSEIMEQAKNKSKIADGKETERTRKIVKSKFPLLMQVSKSWNF